MNFNYKTYSKEINDYFFPISKGINSKTENFINSTNFLKILFNFLIDKKIVEKEEITQYVDSNIKQEIDYGASVGEYLGILDDNTINEIYTKFLIHINYGI
jgi:hypothetical protein